MLECKQFVRFIVCAGMLFTWSKLKSH